MNAGKITLFIFGIIVLLMSFSLIAGGGSLLWMNAKYVDDAGFLTSDTLHVQRNSHAVVAGPIKVDDVALNVLRVMGVITAFEVEGRNHDPSKPIFVGVSDQAKLSNYLDNVNYD